jgi:hypothetical protein
MIDNIPTIGYFNLDDMPNKDPKLNKAITKHQFRLLESKIECLTKAIDKHKKDTPDEDVRICDQKLWSAGEMINYR